MTIRAAVLAVVLAAVVAATPASGHIGAMSWPLSKAMRVIDDVRVRVGLTVVRIDSETSLCSGDGRARTRGALRTWTHFHCTSTTFTARGPGRDVEFRLHALDARRFRITEARWVGR